MENTAVGVCCCLRTCNSVVNMLVMEFVCKISGILLYKNVPPIMGVHCCCLHVNCIVYKHCDRPLHIGSSNPSCVQEE